MSQLMLARISRIDGLSIGFGAIFALVVAAACLGLYLVGSTTIERQVEASIQRDSAKLVGLGPVPGRAEMERRIAALETAHPASSRGHVIFDVQGRLVYGQVEMTSPPAGFSDVTYRDVQSAHDRRAHALGIAMPGGDRLVIFAHSELAQNFGKVLVPLLFNLLVICTAGGMLVTLLLGREIGKRLGRTTMAADAIAAGDLAHRVPLDRLDGVFLLQAQSLNRMLDRMQDLIRNQRQFSSNLAHDLRTPLTRLRGLLSEGRSAGNMQVRTLMMEQAERECTAIIQIFDALLRLSEIEAGCHPAAMTPIPLRPLVEDVVETMEPVLADKGSALALDHADDAWAVADNGLLTQMLVNMLENVALHTPAGTSARISLREDAASGSVLLSVCDDGPGLQPEERERVLRPFVRGKASAQVKGSGLGLAIAQAIVGFHRGELRLVDNLPGLMAEVRLPRAVPGR